MPFDRHTKTMKEIRHNFSYLAPSHEVVAELHAKTQSVMAEAAESLAQMIPDVQEREHAIHKLQEAMFWANAAIARNHDLVLAHAGVLPNSE